MVPISFDRSPVSGGSFWQIKTFKGRLLAVTRMIDGYGGWLNIRFTATTAGSAFSGNILPNDLKI